MEFDIGNILYIVITLVAVIIGVLGKKKKPADGGSGEPGRAARPGFLENLERVLTMGQEQHVIQELQDFEEDLPFEETEPPPATEKSIGDLRNRPGIMEEYERIMSSGSYAAFDLTMSQGDGIDMTLETIELDDLTGTDYVKVIEDFDAGAAVVYSTIINRLDY